jgi:hypothetical protein
VLTNVIACLQGTITSVESAFFCHFYSDCSLLLLGKNINKRVLSTPVEDGVSQTHKLILIYVHLLQLHVYCRKPNAITDIKLLKDLLNAPHTEVYRKIKRYGS